MQTNYIEKFDQWVDAHSEEFLKIKCNVIKCKHWDVKSSVGVYIDFENDLFWSRVTLWPHGSADFEILCAENSDIVYYKASESFSETDIEAWFLEYTTRILTR